MAVINLVWFAGMAPRMGEQHLPPPHATNAENTNLYSGELRPLKRGALAHTFAQPGDDDWFAPKDPGQPGAPWVPPELPDPPSGCVPVTITTQPQDVLGSPGDPFTLTVGVNIDATAPVYYQWFKNNIAIPGAVDASYTGEIERSTKLSPYPYDRYYVVVENPCGREISDSCTVGYAP